MKFGFRVLHPSIAAKFDVGFLITRHFWKARKSIYKVVGLYWAKVRYFWRSHMQVT